MSQMRREISQAKRIVVKVGSSTLTYENSKLNLSQIGRLIREMADLKNQDKEVIFVTSGAVAAGSGELQTGIVADTIPEKQALAAIGQGRLMSTYQRCFSEFGYQVAQILLTQKDLSNRKRYLNSRNTLNQLLKHNIIPIVNENDTVATNEIKFGDNDTLSALVSSLVKADLLILLSDIDGLYTADPRENDQAELIKEVANVAEVEGLAGSSGTKRGTGGMVTKLEAARVATRAGIPMIIANGNQRDVLNDICQAKQLGTLFLPEGNLASRDRWIAFNLDIKGKIVIDSGAEKALLEQGSSLLPSGIKEVAGDFVAGDVVDIINQSGKNIARGLINYSYTETNQIKGLHSSKIKDELGYKDYDEVIHRDNLVFLDRAVDSG